MDKINSLLDAKILNAKSIADLFELVKALVYDHTGMDQAGLLVGVSDLGIHGRRFIGGFYSPNANTIIINKKPLKRILQTDPSLYNYYIFHILLHEYTHSIGIYDETGARILVYEICSRVFGKEHAISRLAEGLETVAGKIIVPGSGFIPPEDTSIEFVPGIDRKNTNYIY